MEIPSPYREHYDTDIWVITVTLESVRKHPVNIKVAKSLTQFKTFKWQWFILVNLRLKV